MQCSICHKLQATIHVLDLEDGSVSEEKHLCPSCAEGSGLVNPKAAPLKISHEMLEDLLGTMQSPGSTEATPGSTEAEAEESCLACGLTISQFRSRGRLGCPRCYDTFRRSLLPLLERVHDATSHKGRCPGMSARLADGDDKLAELRHSLRDAINAENYELAAHFRDQIQSITHPGSGGESQN